MFEVLVLVLVLCCSGKVKPVYLMTGGESDEHGEA